MVSGRETDGLQTNLRKQLQPCEAMGKWSTDLIYQWSGLQILVLVAGLKSCVGAGMGKAGQEDAEGGQKWDWAMKSMTIDVSGEETRSHVRWCLSEKETAILRCPEDISAEETWNSQTLEVVSACLTHHFSSSWPLAGLSAAWAGVKPPVSQDRLLDFWTWWPTLYDRNRDEVIEPHERSPLSWYRHWCFQWVLMRFRHMLSGCSCILQQGELIYKNSLLWQ